MRKRLALTATLLPSAQTTRARSTLLIYDSTLAWAGLLLLAIGLVMVYSGLIAAWIAFQVPVKVWQQIAPWAFVLGLALLVAVLIPGVGRSVNGARRWLPLMVINIQPSEFVKLAVVLY